MGGENFERIDGRSREEALTVPLKVLTEVSKPVHRIIREARVGAREQGIEDRATQFHEGIRTVHVLIIFSRVPNDPPGRIARFP